jgi:hypothetical protein
MPGIVQIVRSEGMKFFMKRVLRGSIDYSEDLG